MLSRNASIRLGDMSRARASAWLLAMVAMVLFALGGLDAPLPLAHAQAPPQGSPIKVSIQLANITAAAAGKYEVSVQVTPSQGAGKARTLDMKAGEPVQLPPDFAEFTIPEPQFTWTVRVQPEKSLESDSLVLSSVFSLPEVLKLINLDAPGTLPAAAPIPIDYVESRRPGRALLLEKGPLVKMNLDLYTAAIVLCARFPESFQKDGAYSLSLWMDVNRNGARDADETAGDEQVAGPEFCAARKSVVSFYNEVSFEYLLKGPGGQTSQPASGSYDFLTDKLELRKGPGGFAAASVGLTKGPRGFSVAYTNPFTSALEIGGVKADTPKLFQTCYGAEVAQCPKIPRDPNIVPPRGEEPKGGPSAWDRFTRWVSDHDEYLPLVLGGVLGLVVVTWMFRRAD